MSTYYVQEHRVRDYPLARIAGPIVSSQQALLALSMTFLSLIYCSTVLVLHAH
jgi:hypothetical protein